ncbi:MAG: SH3 domain-containing protein [Methylotenera sp.]|nr:SH3 domain-containing protein [Methylotenera sp.]
MQSKLGKLKLLSEPSKKSASLGQLAKGDEMVFMGEEKDGFYRVTAINGEGWVDKLLVQKR